MPITSPTIIPLTAEQTLERARKYVQSGQGVGLPELLTLIQTLSSKFEKICLHDLTEVVEKDPVIVGRVLTAANTMRNNPCVTPLTSLTHAIHQLGFQKVRSIAVSLMLLQSTSSASNSKEQREAAAQALCAGIISRSCANSLGLADTEMLFACGILRNLGTVLFPAVSVEHYREAVALKEKLTEEAAYRSMFGLTPLELTRRIMNGWRMPEEILHAMQECEPEEMPATAAGQLDAQVLSISEFSSQMAQSLLCPQGSPDDCVKKSYAIAKRFKHLLPDASALIEPAIEHTRDNLNTLAQCGVSIHSTTFLRLRSSFEPKQAEEVEVSTAASAAPNSASKSEADTKLPPEKPLTPHAASESESDDASRQSRRSPDTPDLTPLDDTPRSDSDDWSRDLTAVGSFEAKHVEPDDSASANATKQPADPWMEALQAIKEMMQADQCAIFLGPKGRKLAVLQSSTENLVGKYGPIDTCRGSDRTVFGVCLNRRETILIHDALETRINHYLPQWLQQVSQRPGAFMLLPLSEDQAADGLIYITWAKSKKIVITPTQCTVIRSFVTNQLGKTKIKL